MKGGPSVCVILHCTVPVLQAHHHYPSPTSQAHHPFPSPIRQVISTALELCRLNYVLCVFVQLSEGGSYSTQSPVFTRGEQSADPAQEQVRTARGAVTLASCGF